MDPFDSGKPKSGESYDRCGIAVIQRKRKEKEKLLRNDDIISESIRVKEGDWARNIEGSLQCLEGMIKYIDRHKRIATIEMELFGRMVSMKVSLEVLALE